MAHSGAGRPIRADSWRWLTDHRNPGSPAWLPRFRDGSFVRFMNQHGEAAEPPGPNAPWGPMRIVYLQYASDPATFFDYRSLYREPDPMLPPRGPDVSPQLRWYPVVTLFQLMLDMFMATEAPIGYGHVYASADYIDAWIEVRDVRDWAAGRNHAAEAAPLQGRSPRLLVQRHPLPRRLSNTTIALRLRERSTERGMWRWNSLTLGSHRAPMQVRA
jgi:uncharacterized membrane protein